MRAVVPSESTGVGEGGLHAHSFCPAFASCHHDSPGFFPPNKTSHPKPICHRQKWEEPAQYATNILLSLLQLENMQFPPTPLSTHTHTHTHTCTHTKHKTWSRSFQNYVLGYHFYWSQWLGSSPCFSPKLQLFQHLVKKKEAITETVSNVSRRMILKQQV